MKATTNTIDVSGGTIIVTRAGGAGSLASVGLKCGDERWDSCVDGVEALILALAVAGFDVGKPGFARAVQSALGSLEDNC